LRISFLFLKTRTYFNEQFWFSALRVLDTYTAILDDAINNNSRVY